MYQSCRQPLGLSASDDRPPVRPTPSTAPTDRVFDRPILRPLDIPPDHSSVQPSDRPSDRPSERAFVRPSVRPRDYFWPLPREKLSCMTMHYFVGSCDDPWLLMDASSYPVARGIPFVIVDMLRRDWPLSARVDPFALIPMRL